VIGITVNLTLPVMGARRTQIERLRLRVASSVEMRLSSARGFERDEVDQDGALFPPRHIVHLRQ
jgi:hypothetical protein